MNIARLFLSIASIGVSLTVFGSESPIPAESVPLYNLSGFVEPGSNWSLASRIVGDPLNDKVLVTEPGVGILVNQAPKASGQNLFTSWEHGDVEVELEFLMAKGSNSGVYFQSRYEVQLLDSWGVEEPKFSDCGGIYERYIEEKGYGYEGVAPRVNACRAPGLWQRLKVQFRAPRFNEAGEKVENARFVEVVLNGVVLHENVEVTGPTRSAVQGAGGEKALAPMMIQGNHGPVAFRNISFKHLGDATVGVSDLKCEVRSGKGLDIRGLDAVEVESTPVVTSLDPSVLGAKRGFSATYNGLFEIPTTGLYAFHASGAGGVRLVVDGQVAVEPFSRGGRSVPIQLEQGSKSFRLDYVHNTWRKPSMSVRVEGPGMWEQALTPESKEGEETVSRLIIEPDDDRIRVQRAFIPYEPRKRLYAMAVGSPNGVHYAYDFDRAAIIHAWSGDFLDMYEMWHGRGTEQIAKPAGPSITFPIKPTVAFIKTTEDDWPVETESLWRPAGYVLDSDGQPEFHARYGELFIRDRIVAKGAPRRLERTLEIEGKHSNWKTGVLLAEASQITSIGDGRYIIGERAYYIDVSDECDTEPFVRRVNGHDQLMLWVPKSESKTSISYSLVW